LILGYADLAASLGHRPGADQALWDPARHQILVAARSADLEAIDGPWLGIADDDPFRAAAGRARDFGYDGKWAIHPAQIPALNEIFTPDEAEIEHARRVIEALDRAAAEATGAVSLDGQMIDRALEVAARRTLSRADV
jgi:citrate lyase subunit beta/citryl-CoA lyase